MKTTPCTEQKSHAFSQSPRCSARTQQNTPCQSHAVRGKPRCRMHGCGRGAPNGTNYAVTNGFTTTEEKLFRK